MQYARRIQRLQPLFLASFCALSTAACDEETYLVFVEPQLFQSDLVGTWGGTDPVEIGRVIRSGDEVRVEALPPTPRGPYTVGAVQSSPWFQKSCFPLRVSPVLDDDYEQGLDELDLAGPHDSGYDRVFRRDSQVYISGLLHRSYVEPGGNAFDFAALIVDPDNVSIPAVTLNPDDKTITVTCEVTEVATQRLFDLTVSGPGTVTLRGDAPSTPVVCAAENSPCTVLTRASSNQVALSVDAASLGALSGFQDGAAGTCPLATTVPAADLETGPGDCVAVFEGWSVGYSITPPNLGLDVTASAPEVRIDDDRVRVLSDQVGEATVSIANNGVPVPVVAASGACRVGASAGTVVFERPASGTGTCQIEVEPDPGTDAHTLSLVGSTAPSFTVSPGPRSGPATCTTSDAGVIACTDAGGDVALPLTWPTPTEVTVEIPETTGRVAFAGDCQPPTPGERVATVRVEGRQTCGARVFHVLEITSQVDVRLTPGPGGGPTTLCSPGLDTVDCDGDGFDDVIEYDRPTRVNLEALTPASFALDCTESTTTPDTGEVFVRDRVECNLAAESAQSDARLEIVLGADSGQPASRVVVLDPMSGSEVDRCAFDTASGFASRSCVLTNLPRTMVLAPEADGDGGQSYASFLRFDSDCAGDLTEVSNGYELDIVDLLMPAEAPSNNSATCTAVFGCTPDAVVDQLDIQVLEGTTVHASLSLDVATDCTQGATRFTCMTGQVFDVPENTTLDVAYTFSGGGPATFDSFLLNFSPSSVPQFQKTSSGQAQAILELDGCELGYQVVFILE